MELLDTDCLTVHVLSINWGFHVLWHNYMYIATYYIIHYVLYLFHGIIAIHQSSRKKLQ